MTDPTRTATHAPPRLRAGTRDLVWLHAGFLALAVVLVATLRIGPAALVAVVVYSGALLALARVRDDATLLRLWWFAAVLSVWQVLPDLVLVEVGTLTFPPDGVSDIGTVTLPMAGMWAVPTVLVVLAGDEVERRRGVTRATLAAAAAALVVYATAEAILPRLGVWEPVGVRTVGTVAPYILAAEVVLGAVTWHAWRVARERPATLTAVLALLVSLTYTGGAVVSWLLLEA